MSDDLVIVIKGMPAPMGSKRVVRGRVIEMSKRLRPWQDLVQAGALRQIAATPDWSTLTGPVAAEVSFTMPRPRSHFGSGRNALRLREAAPTYPAKVPDVDKLLRGVCDALTRAQVWRDDAQLVEVLARKNFVGVGFDALNEPGVVIRVVPLLCSASPDSPGVAT